MNSDKSKNEVILHQLNYLSKRYDELLKDLEQTEDIKHKPTANKRSWTAFLRKNEMKTPK